MSPGAPSPRNRAISVMSLFPSPRSRWPDRSLQLSGSPEQRLTGRRISRAGRQFVSRAATNTLQNHGSRWRVRTEPLGQTTVVFVSLLFFLTVSFELTMNQLFCAPEAPSLTVLATTSDWHVDELRASVKPAGPTPLMILLMRSEWESLEDHSARMASSAAMLAGVLMS